MATPDSTETAAEPLLKPFQWHSAELNHFPGINFAARALDLSNGIRCVLDILRKNTLEGDFGTALLDANQEGCLMGLVIAASDTLASEACHYLEWAKEHGRDACRSFSELHAEKGNQET